MDNNKISLNQVIAKFKKDVLPMPIPPVQFQFEETPGGVSCTAYVPGFDYIGHSTFSTEKVPDAVKINRVPGHTIVSNSYSPCYSAGTVSNTTSLTSVELSLKKEAVERMVREVAQAMDDVYRSQCSEIYSTMASTQDDYGDALKYSLNALYKMPIFKSKDVVMMDNHIPVTPPEKPEGPAQLELF